MKEKIDLVCFICHQKAKTVALLQRHIRNEHKGVDIYACPCDKGFSRKQVYEDHLNCKHVLKITYPCERGCQKDFLTSSARRAHYLRCHSGYILKCTFPGCGKIFTRSDALKRHSKEHDVISITSEVNVKVESFIRFKN
ncbi:hypothetical protein SteCoe_17284 [Stentor coeruleus]|uniref:C2H2-type domain-containing protein n=1 Tax=Stentor coeruleus TaxID=5963 RepID=A0A1R2BZC2_9CILI|nr:hypothetical protein SteCoe_17284 [Stentor coeruleus]